jgi:hypothetical protein|nr:MAG TPA: hypothetical protein [Caudoviricetes sp.]
MRGINKQAMLDLIIEAKRNEPEDVRFSDWLAEYLADRLSTLTPPNEPLTRAERHQYTRAELESITQETAIYIEGAGIAQLQWGGLEIAEGVKDGYLYCKHIKPFAMDLYDKYWTAWDRPAEEDA